MASSPPAEHVTAETVQGWFQEWQNLRPRARLRPIPKVSHCTEIARALSVQTAKGSAESQNLSASYRNYFSRLSEANIEVSTAKKSLEKAKKLYNGLPEPRVEWPKDWDKLLSAVQEFLKWDPGNSGSEYAFSLDSLIYTNLVAKSPHDAGWKTISRSSDGGPVTYVVAKCLELSSKSILSAGKEIKAASIGRRAREAKARRIKG